MSCCGTFKCGLRRFDGHGSSSYRPTNPEAVKEFNSSMQAMMAERARQDSGQFQVITSHTTVQTPISAPVQVTIEEKPAGVFYGLSDAGFSANKKQASPK